MVRVMVWVRVRSRMRTARRRGVEVRLCVGVRVTSRSRVGFGLRLSVNSSFRLSI